MKRMKTWMGILAGGVLLLSGCDDVFETDLTGCPVRLLAPGDSVTTVVARQLFLWEPLEGATAYRLRIATPDFCRPEPACWIRWWRGAVMSMLFSREYTLGEYGPKTQPGQGNMPFAC